MKKLIALFGLLALLLAGCSAISSGTITDKEHHEGYYYPVTYCVYYTSKGLCAMTGTREDYSPPNWIFDLKQGKDTGWVYVSEDTYGRYETGDYFAKTK